MHRISLESLHVKADTEQKTKLSNPQKKAQGIKKVGTAAGK